MTPPEFRAALAGLDLSQAEFARTLAQLGRDPRPPATIYRQIQGYALGEVQIPSPLAALLTVLGRVPPEVWR